MPADWNQTKARKSAQMAIEQAERDFCRASVDKKVDLFRTFVAEDAIFHSAQTVVRGPDAVVKDCTR